MRKCSMGPLVLAVTGGVSIVKCGRLTQQSCMVFSHTHLLSYTYSYPLNGGR